jgi:hypothetical protein
LSNLAIEFARFWGLREAGISPDCQIPDRDASGIAGGDGGTVPLIDQLCAGLANKEQLTWYL